MATVNKNKTVKCSRHVDIWYASNDTHQTQDVTLMEINTNKSLLKYPGRHQFASLNGYLPVLNYDCTLRERHLNLGSWNYQGSLTPFNGKWGRDQHSGANTLYVSEQSNDVPIATADHSGYAALESSAIARMNSEVRNQSMSVFETVFEGRKTVELILGTLAQLTQAAKAARRGDMSGAARHLGVSWTKRKPAGGLSDRWLALRYGWQPLCYEVYGAMKGTYDAMQLYPGKIMHAKGRANNRLHNQYPVTKTYGWNTFTPYAGAVSYGVNFKYQMVASETDHLMVEAFAVYRITNPTLAGATGFGLTNPLLTGWELLPLSFVADWFVNVSDVLGQLDAWTGRQYLTGGVTRTLRATRTAESKHVSTQPDYIMGGFIPARSVYNTVVVRRRSFTNPPLVVPQYYASVNWKRMIDGITLFRQAIR